MDYVPEESAVSTKQIEVLHPMLVEALFTAAVQALTAAS